MGKVIFYTNAKKSLNMGNYASDKLPLIVNTCGAYCSEDTPFETNHADGRVDFYLLYLTNGSITVYLDNEPYLLNPGDVIIYPPNTPYRYVGECGVKYLYVHFTGSFARELLDHCNLSPLPSVFRLGYHSELHSLFVKLNDAFSAPNKLKTLICASFLEQIILFIATGLDKNANSVFVPTTAIEKSLLHIESYFTTTIHIPDLAKIEGLSNSRYIALFSSIMGKSPSAYIIELRIRRACNLLKSTNYTIKDIAERCGYSDQYFFSKLFKKHMGVSPKAYRLS